MDSVIDRMFEMSQDVMICHEMRYSIEALKNPGISAKPVFYMLIQQNDSAETEWMPQRAQVRNNMFAFPEEIAHFAGCSLALVCSISFQT